MTDDHKAEAERVFVRSFEVQEPSIFGAGFGALAGRSIFPELWSDGSVTWAEARS